MRFKNKSISLYFFGLHGKLLGINVTHKSKLKWAIIIISYIVFVGWTIQSEMPFILKLVIVVIATYRLLVSINS